MIKNLNNLLCCLIFYQVYIPNESQQVCVLISTCKSLQEGLCWVVASKMHISLHLPNSLAASQYVQVGRLACTHRFLTCETAVRARCWLGTKQALNLIAALILVMQGSAGHRLSLCQCPVDNLLRKFRRRLNACFGQCLLWWIAVLIMPRNRHLCRWQADDSG